MWRSSTHRITVTMIQLRPQFAFTDDTPYLTLTGELWGFFREIVKKIWPRYIESALDDKNFAVCRYITVYNVNASLKFQEMIKLLTPYSSHNMLLIFLVSLMSHTASFMTISKTRQCFNVLWTLVFTKCFSIPVPFHSVGNKTYYIK